MDQSILFILLVVAAVAVMVYTQIAGNKKFKQNIKEQFGKDVIPPDFVEDASGYWKARRQHEESLETYIDDTTWDDLDMDRIFAKINACQTSAGAENLYSMLREPLFDTDVLEVRESLMALLGAKPRYRFYLQLILAKMGKMPGHGLYDLYFYISPNKITRPWLYKAMALLPFLCAASIALQPAVGGVLLFSSFLANMAIHYFSKKRISREMASVRYFGTLLWAAGKIGKKNILDGHSIGRDISESREVFKKLGGKISGMLREKVSILDGVIEYVRILLLSNIRAYNRIMSAVEKHQAEFRRLYSSVGALDALIAVLSYRKTLPYYSLPEFHDGVSIAMKGGYHPLLKQPVPNSATLSRNIVSGSNASGKSTFIKSAAVNGIFAQTIHTCTAKSFSSRPSLVMTSMAVRDDITKKESYFITEIKSIRRIITNIPRVFCACYIDEILKGTNTIERIAASAAVLRFLEGLDCICVVATHDIELTRMLPGYVNLHFGEQITENGVEFDFKVKQGPSATKNAIKLLDHMEFDKKIIDGAEKLVSRFEKTQAWDTPE
jgi:DNA mismatch repair ATPase MutS